MSNFDLQKILEAWMLATGEEKDFDRIRLGVESDWLCHKAKQMLTKDPTGVLSAFAMRAAYVKYIKEHHMTVEELVKGEWDKIKDYWKNLYNQLYVDNAGPLIKSAEDQVIKIINSFGENVTTQDLYDNDFEKVFVDAFDKYDQYRADVFRNPDNLSKVTDVGVGKKLFYFEHYKQFVDALKSTSEENIIAVAFIDRTAEKVETEYDERFDKFFAFGIKRNNGVAVVSDRVVYSSLEHTYKTRNPARDMDNKIDYSHLPYYKYDKIIEQFDKPSQLLLTSGNTEEKTKFCVEFDIEGYIYIATILNIIHNRYFETDEGWNKKPVLFSSEVKFLTEAQSKELVVKDETAIILPELTVTAHEYKGSEKIFNNGIYDFYSEMFPVTDVVKFDFNAVATKEDMENNAWWAVRKAQADAIIKGLQDSYNNKRREEITGTIVPKIKYHLQSLLDYVMTHNDSPYFDKYSMDKEEDKPVLYKEWAKQADLDTIQVTSKQYKSTSDWFDPKYYSRRYNVSYVDDLSLYHNEGSSIVHAWWNNDNSSRAVDITLKFRSYTDLVKYLKFDSVNDLPRELQHWLYPRVDSWSIAGWRPYNGNSILHFTDPMNDLRDPWHEFPIQVVFHMSKSKYNKLVKEYGNLRTCGVKVESDD